VLPEKSHAQTQRAMQWNACTNTASATVWVTAGAALTKCFALTMTKAQVKMLLMLAATFSAFSAASLRSYPKLFQKYEKLLRGVMAFRSALVLVTSVMRLPPWKEPCVKVEGKLRSIASFSPVSCCKGCTYSNENILLLELFHQNFRSMPCIKKTISYLGKKLIWKITAN